MQRDQSTKNNTTNVGLGFNYSPLLGFGLQVGYTTTTNETYSSERTVPQPAITSESRYAIEAAPPRGESRYAIEAAPPRAERQYAAEAAPSRPERQYAAEAALSRPERRYAVEDAPSRSERQYAAEAALSRPERQYAAEAAPSRPNNRYPIISFYKNEVPSGPQGYYIETILKNWSGNYKQLDDFYNYIQWLFPNRKPGKNPNAPLLTDSDVEEICSISILHTRALNGFELMLDYLGMRLLNQSQTFALTDNSSERLKLISSPKTSMAITRILHFLREINEEQLMMAWLKFFADLINQKKIDNSVKYSFNEFWIKTLDNRDEDKIKNYIRSINNN